MKVQHIGLTNFMRHDNTGLIIPDTGVVVLTGPNGGGKSSFIEAAAFGYFGETLRETPPWRPLVSGSMTIDGSLGYVERESVAPRGTKKLAWRDPTEDDVRKYDTPSKAEAELAKTVGSFDLWRRTHVFSSADAANFSTMVDSKRKAMVESILGTARFHDASAACRKELAEARQHLATNERAITATTTRSTELRRSLGNLIEPALVVPATPPVIDPGGTDADLATAQVRLVAANTVWEAALAEPQTQVSAESVVAITNAEAVVRIALAAKDLAVAGKCTTCGQTYAANVADTEAALATRHQELAMAKTHRGTEQDLALAANEQRLQRIADAREEFERQSTYTTELRVRLERAAERQAEIARHSATCSQIESQYRGSLTQYQTSKLAIDTEIVDLEDALDRLLEIDRVAQHDVAELEVCDKVLGLKGVRVPVLGKALGAAETLANTWLRQMPLPIQVSLRAFRVLKNGKTNDDIGFEVEGVGGGYGYKATSGGERRSIDAALLLAFAEVASAASGQPGGTLWMDEIFDALDLEGCRAVANIIADIGTRRSIVVITHRLDLMEMIAQACRGAVAHTQYRVENGRLSTAA